MTGSNHGAARNRETYRLSRGRALLQKALIHVHSLRFVSFLPLPQNSRPNQIFLYLHLDKNENYFFLLCQGA